MRILAFASALFICLLGSYAKGYAGTTTPFETDEVIEGKTLARIPGNARHIEVDGDYAYVGFGSGGELFTIIDITNKTAPFIAGQVDLGTGTQELAKIGDAVYVESGFNLLVIDVANPGTPTQIASYPINPAGLFQYAGLLYVFTSNELFVFDVSDPLNLTQVGQLTFFSTGLTESYASRNYAFSNNILFLDIVPMLIIDIADPTNLRIMEILGTQSAFDVTPNRFVGLSSGCSTTCESSIGVSSYSLDPWSTEFLGYQSEFGSSGAFALEIDHFNAYASRDTGLTVYDLYEEGNTPFISIPKLIAHYDIKFSRDVLVVGDYVYAAGPHGFYIAAAIPTTAVYLPVLLQQQ